MTDRPLAVIVMAAGQGTRMKSSRPKVLHRLGGTPMLGHVLSTAAALGAEYVVTVVRHERDSVAEVVHEFLPNAIIVDQDDIPGTGRSVELGLTGLPENFAGDVLVLSSDVPMLDAETLRGLIEGHRAAANALTMLSTRQPDPTGFGRILRDESGAVVGIVEQKDASEDQRAISEVNAGVYAFECGSLRLALTQIEINNTQQEKYLTDAASLIRAAGGRIDAVTVEDRWLVQGVNDRVQLAELARELNARIVRHWQVEGVTIVDPATTWIDQAVQLAPDVELLPNTQLQGATVVGVGAVIGPDTTLTDTEVGPGAVVKKSDATLAVIGANASVGPFAYLRPGTYLGENGKIGTFVETKNSRIGDGSKVPHLSYVGDAVIGEHTNLGAGAITANYDDLAKHRTEIGSHVHTGSHNVFVAPVTIGDGAKTGAGAVIRKDVSPGSLAMSVAPQRNIDGWVEKNRAGTEAAQAAAAAVHDKAGATGTVGSDEKQ